MLNLWTKRRPAKDDVVISISVEDYQWLPLALCRAIQEVSACSAYPINGRHYYEMTERRWLELRPRLEKYARQQIQENPHAPNPQA